MTTSWNTQYTTLLQQQIASLVRQYGYVDVRKALAQYAEQVLDDARAAELKRMIDETDKPIDDNIRFCR